MRKLWLALALGAALTISSCAPSHLRNCDEETQKLGWDEDHRDTACYAGDKYKFLHENEDRTGYVYVYSVLTWEDMEKQLVDAINMMEEVQDYKNEEDSRFLDFMGLREIWKHDTKVLMLRLGMVRAAKFHAIFQELTGQASPYESREKRMGYDVRKIMLPLDPAAMSFVVPEIEKAKQEGRLEQMDELTRARNQKYGKQVKDPAHLTDPNAFQWEKRARGMRWIAYRIKADGEKPDKNLGDYVEGFRIRNGKQETRPAARIFHIKGAAIAVISSGKEGEDPDFGLPNFVESIALQDLDAYDKDPNLQAKLFPEKTEKQNEPPKRPEIVVEISPVDGKARNVWQEKKDGWKLPEGYRIGPKNENYRVKIEYKGKGMGDESAEYRDVESVIKVWTAADYSSPSVGAVWEYYRPKPRFASQMKATVLDGQKKVQFEFSDGSPQVVGTIVARPNDYIENEPYAVAVTEGKVRWLYMKSPGSAVFDKKRVIPVPKNNDSSGFKMEDETMQQEWDITQKAEKGKH